MRSSIANMRERMLPKAVVFDMDGVLVDSEARWEEFHAQVWGSFGLEDPKKVEEEIIGMNLTDTAEHIRGYNPELSESEVKTPFQKAAEVIYKKRTELMPGARALLERLKDEGIPCAIGSSSSSEWIGWVVSRFSLGSYFSYFCSTESDNLSGKPDPVVYNKAIRLLGALPEATVVFEDTMRGLKAAAGSGARTVAVPDERWSRGDFSIADIVVESLEDPALYEYLGL